MRSATKLIVAAAVLLPSATASIIPNFLKSFDELQDLQKRCDNPCGWEGKLCCGAGETCYTDSNNQAQCGAGVAAAGTWTYTTSTYLLINSQTITTTISSFVAAASSTTSCKYAIGETSCGSTCCNSEQFCESIENSRCKDTGSGSSGFYSSMFTVTTIITDTAESPLRPTSDTLVTVTATGTAGGITTTQGFISPTGSIVAEQSGGGGGSGLSTGAIVGIVFGVLAAIIILILICLCCCAKGLLDALLGIFGLGPRERRREKETEIYESRHHHGSRRGRSTSAAPRRTWYGARVKRGSDVSEKKSGIGRATGVAAFLASLAIILGLKRRRDRKDNKSDVSYGSSSYSDYTSSTESSSDRRTRRSSRSRSRAYSASRASRR